MKKQSAILLTALLLVIRAGAQDFHVSHYDVATLYMNPATTGMYDGKGDYKVYVDTRSQWRQLGVKPFFTTYLAYDMPYMVKDQKIGLGAYFINNRTGPGNFNTTQFQLSGAYDVLSKKAAGKHCLSAGVQLGLFYKSFSNANLTYDAQYSPSTDGGSFDKSISSGETYNSQNIFRFDANFGLYYRLLDKDKRAHPYVGFSLAHLTRPNESFIGTTSRMPMRIMVNGGCGVYLDDEKKLEIVPRFLYMSQAQSSEINGGMLFYYRFNDNNVKLMVGADYRYKDAVILSLGISEEGYALRFSYDVNNSYLNAYTKSRGAWELSLIFTGQKGKSFKELLPHFKFGN